MHWRALVVTKHRHEQPTLHLPHHRQNRPHPLPAHAALIFFATSPIIAAYKEIHEDSTRSKELREFANRCLKLNNIREKILEAVSMIHDEPSAVKAGEVLTRYNDEIDDLNMLRYYIEIKDKLSKEEQEMLDQLLLRRYDEATAFLSKYLRIWEERELEQYESKVEIILKSVILHTKYHPLWTDYMYRGRCKPGIQIEESVKDLIFELDESNYIPVLFRNGL